MEATGRWEATLRLRASERQQLNLTPGQRLLDVGCGLGDAALRLADDLGNDGEIVGIDVSAEMIAGARSPGRARRGAGSGSRSATPLSLPSRIGPFRHLLDPNGHLQWLTDPKAAVAEMARVLRPGALLSLIDTDWSTFDIDAATANSAKRVHNAMQIRATPTVQYREPAR